jgi:two-component system nitrogen regulation response regulator GlnG
MEHFRLQYAVKHHTEPFTLDDAARETWQRYAFPGNVRELKNIVIRLTAKHAGYSVGNAELLAEFELPEQQSPAVQPIGGAFDPRHEIESNTAFDLDVALAAVELKYIDAAIELSRGNMSQAARVLGVSRSTLYSRLETLRPGTGKMDS